MLKEVKMFWFRKKIILGVMCVVLGLVLVLVLAGSASIAQPKSIYDPSWHKGVESLTYGNAGTLAADPAIKLLIDQFEAQTGIKIHTIEIPGTQEEEYARSFSLREPFYDVIWTVPMRSMPTFAQLGWIIPLDDIVPPSLKAQFPPAVVRGCTFNGKLYIIPDQYTTPNRILLYRKDLFKKMGLELPRDWDELVSIAKKLTQDLNGDGVIDRYGIVYDVGLGKNCLWTFISYLYLAGGRMWKPDGSPAFNSPEGVAALRFLVDLRNKYKVAPSEVSIYQVGNVYTSFISKGAGMASLEYSDKCRRAIDALGEENVGGALLPPMKAGIDYKILGEMNGVAVSAFSKHKEAAKRFALEFASWPHQFYNVVIEHLSTALPSVMNNWYVRTEAPLPFMDVIIQARQSGRTFVEYHPYTSIVTDVLSMGVQKALSEEQTPKQALDWMVSEMKKKKVF